MYAAEDDPYCYPGTSVLKNRLDLRDAAELARFEAQITAQRADEPLTLGPLNVETYCALHRHLFGDVFGWAGEFRTIRIAKQGSMFCYPEHIGREMERLFAGLAGGRELAGLTRQAFAEGAAHVISDLNAIHPFREGNGRTQNIFLGVLARRAGHPLEFRRLDPKAMLAAVIAAFDGDEAPLTEAIADLATSS